jgi:hypothetical protein
VATSFDQIMMAQTDDHDDPSFTAAVAALINAAGQRDWAKMRACLEFLHPGFELNHPDLEGTHL